jgi:hypothetical protein
MKSRVAVLVALLAVAFVALGVAGFGPFGPLIYNPVSIAANGGVTEVDLIPAPEGPPLTFKRVATAAGGIRPLTPAERFIPDPLPAPLFQWLCNRGGNMVVILGNGKNVTYGPCYRPASINRLWAELVPPGPPGSAVVRDQGLKT